MKYQKLRNQKNSLTPLVHMIRNFMMITVIHQPCIRVDMNLTVLPFRQNMMMACSTVTIFLIPLVALVVHLFIILMENLTSQ